MRLIHLVVIAGLLPAAALAQGTAQSDLPPPPLVPAGAPPPTPPPEPGTTPPTTQPQPGTPAPPTSASPYGTPPTGQQPGTPPPPSATPPAGYSPNRPPSGYQYSPYGTPLSHEKPPPEVGLMISESLFGMLTAGGITILPYVLLFATGTLGGLDPTISALIFSALFVAAPLSVAQTQTGIANGSRYYAAESWWPLLAGLGAEGGLLAIFFAAGGVNSIMPGNTPVGGLPPSATGLILFFIASVAVVPLIQMAVINIFKIPRPGMIAALEDKGVHVFPPTVAPLLTQTPTGPTVGVNVSFLNARF